MALSTQVRAFPWKYDVFLSFRGEDTRRGFTDYLYKELTRRGITTFQNNPDLERGTAISPELLSAIEDSRFAIVVLSPHYASSSWCLLELSKILQCMEERGRVLPVFYEVDPSHVRHQRGIFAEAFDEHEEKLGGDSKEVEGWRDALTKVANFAGWSSKDYRYETELIKEIVQALWTNVYPSQRSFGSSELVGMDTKLEEIYVLLDKEANDVRFVGIWGMGGLGKTTLARLIYENISDQFEVCIFLSNVREVSKTHGLVHLQKQMLYQILKEENVQVWDVFSGITMTKRCLRNKAVLLVLDDVDQEEQLKTLVGEKDWFGLGTRIIITTRDRHVLVTHGIEKPYELKGLNKVEARQLFSLKAFKKYEPEADYAELSKSFVDYAGGLPLALKTWGSFLYGRSPQAWSSALEDLRKTPNRTVFDLLKVSYEGLDETEKKIFLDIACFSLQNDAKFIVELLYSSDIRTRIAIEVLVEKSLLTISSINNEISIHYLIKEMACEIVRQESYEEPGERSRLWLREDICHVFRMNRGTEAIEGIFLHLHKLEEADWNLEAFSKMCRLKLLYIHNLRISSGPKYLPDALRFLIWSWYPSRSLPPGFQPDELTVLSLIHSNIDHLWKGIKYLGKLKSMDLSHSLNLTRTPDFTGTPNLEELVLEGCTNLVKIHPSIALLKRLRIWNFRNCKSIKSLPSEVEMESLETFDVSGCSKLKMVPEFVGQMKRLSKLLLGGTAVGKLPSSFEHLSESLEELDLSGIVIREPSYSLFLKKNLRVSSFGFFARKIPHPLIPLLSSLFSFLTSLNLNDCNLCEGEIPNDIGSLSSLKTLGLRGNNFVPLPASIHLLSELGYLDVDPKSVDSIIHEISPQVKEPTEIVYDMECITSLDLSGTAIKELPSSIRYLRSLEELVLRECKKLTNLPSNIFELQHLWCLDLQNCSRLVAFPRWSSASLKVNSNVSHGLWYVNLHGCKRLEEIPELPPKVEWINVANCLQLTRFAKFSNILVREDSEMIKCIRMFNCQRLCASLALEVAENGDTVLNDVCSLFLSCKQSEFDIVFPGTEVPKWFCHRKDLMKSTDKCEFSFPIPPNFSLWNKGFAICAAAAAVENNNAEEKEIMQQCSLTATIDINADKIVTRSFYFEGKDIEVAHVWLCYIPFVKFVSRQSPPFTCGVSLEYTSQGPVRCKSYGVHLVTPEYDEDEDEDDDDDDDDEDEDEDEDEDDQQKMINMRNKLV